MGAPDIAELSVLGSAAPMAVCLAMALTKDFQSAPRRARQNSMRANARLDDYAAFAVQGGKILPRRRLLSSTCFARHLF